MEPGHLMNTARGGEKLSVVFWYCCVLGQLGVVLLLLAVWTLVGHSLPATLQTVAGVLIAIPVVAYEIWVLVSLWTCTFNVKVKIWGYAARAYVVINVVGYVQGAYEASRWVAERVA